MSRMRLRTAVMAGLLIALSCLASPPANAMDWTRSHDIRTTTVVYTGVGAVAFDDAERLAALIESTKSAGARHQIVDRVFNSRTRPRVALNSLGGNAVGGLRLGAFIRESGFDTLVAADAECHSACTMAFLGGVSRAVLGKFGVHAMAFDQEATKASGGLGDKHVYQIQALSSLLVNYTRDMLGVSEMADASLRFGSRGTMLVSDIQLRDWNVITVASRPQQKFQGSDLSTIDCAGSVTGFVVRSLVCGSLTFARNDIAITKALKTLRARSDATQLDTQQVAWRSFRDRCEDRARAPLIKSLKQPVDWNSYSKTYGESSVEDCLNRAYQVRLRELEALVAYYDARDNPTAAQGWHGATK